MSKEKVAILIDVQNLYHSAKLFCGGKISYKHLLEAIGKDREVVQAKAYAAHKDYKGSKNFYNALKALNVDVVSKKVNVKEHGTDSKVIPVRFDVEIAVDALTVPEEVNTVVLCTGNGNFAYLAKALVDEGLNVEVWSFGESTSHTLIRGEGWRFVPIPPSCMLGSTPEEIEQVVEAT